MGARHRAGPEPGGGVVKMVGGGEVQRARVSSYRNVGSGSKEKKEIKVERWREESGRWKVST